MHVVRKEDEREEEEGDHKNVCVVCRERGRKKRERGGVLLTMLRIRDRREWGDVVVCDYNAMRCDSMREDSVDSIRNDPTHPLGICEFTSIHLLHICKYTSPCTSSFFGMYVCRQFMGNQLDSGEKVKILRLNC